MYSEHSDESLMQRWVNARDKESFKVLYLRHRLMVYRLSMGYLGNTGDAEDVTQDIFIKTLLNKADQFTGNSFKAWLSTIVRNACVDMIRSRNASKIDPNIDVDSEESLDNLNIGIKALSPEEIVNRTQQDNCHHDWVWTALHKLPLKQREVVVLRYYSDLSSKEISRILGCGENNVNVNLHHALKKLASFKTTPEVES